MKKNQLKDDKNQSWGWGEREHGLWNKCPKKIRGHGLERVSPQKGKVRLILREGEKRLFNRRINRFLEHKFFLINKLILLLFIFGCVGSSFLCKGFL